MEGFAGFMMKLVLGELQAHGAKWGPDALANVNKQIDYSEYGGAPLLGVNRIAIIGHGRSDPKAVRNALRTTVDLADRGIIQEIQEELERVHGGKVASS